MDGRVKEGIEWNKRKSNRNEKWRKYMKSKKRRKMYEIEKLVNEELNEKS